MRQKLLLTFFATAFALCSWANGVIIDGINYVLTSSNKTACVTYTGSNYSSNNTYTGSVVIPETVTYDGTTYSVRSISDNAFWGCMGLTSIT
ncbi:MAG: hypothetical protein IJT13_05620, partial [Bacteroidaceae bacterium]|nr:hypothetical protein [Bacteroidaceae bacterium]